MEDFNPEWWAIGFLTGMTVILLLKVIDLQERVRLLKKRCDTHYLLVNALCEAVWGRPDRQAPEDQDVYDKGEKP